MVDSPNTYLNQTPHIEYQQMKSGDIHINPGPTDNPCHICKNEVDTQHHLQCDTCDTWLHSDCVMVNQSELSAYETFDIPFMCPICEWDKCDLEDIDFDVLMEVTDALI